MNILCPDRNAKLLLKQNSLILLEKRMFNCVKDLREVVGITNKTNKAVVKKVILVAEEQESEKRKINQIFSALRKMKLCRTKTLLMKF